MKDVTQDVTKDVTKDTTAEEEKVRREISRIEKLNLIGQMAAAVAHEIRNPMTVVRGYIQRIMAKTGGEFDAQFKLVLEELDRANHIITEFLSVARETNFDKTRSSLNGIIAGMYPLIETEALRRGINIILETGPLPELELNPEEMRQLLLNLSFNAMDAMDKGGLLKIKTFHDGDCVRLIVEDTGHGISPSRMERLFEPFYTTKKNGTGLGLTVCKRIAENHGGGITIMSEEGKGTRVTVTFKLS